MEILTALCLAGIVPAYVFLRLLSQPKQPASYPPGPPRRPLIGNLLDLPLKQMWLRALDWKNMYGDITYLNVFGLSLVILNSPDAAVDLLEKRGAIYSDKPYLTMAGELCGCDNMVAFSHYGDQSRRQRKVMNRAFGLSRVAAYDPLAATEMKTLLARLVAPTPGNGEDWAASVRRYSGALTLSVVYGYQVKTDDDAFLAQAEEAVEILSNKIAGPGVVWLVDIFPSLKRLPNSVATFKQKAEKWKEIMEAFVDAPFAFAKEQSARGEGFGFCKMLMDEAEERMVKGTESKEQIEQGEWDLKWTANSMYAASLDTSITTTAHFVLALLRHPFVLHRARAEIDAVLSSPNGDGPTRLPTHEDRSRLPYVDAVFSEVLRWAAPVPINLPHRLMQDDIYNGMFIPKGAIVFGNIWAFVRDPVLFPDPESFDPMRYMPAELGGPNVDAATKARMDPRAYIFGFGRRRCPGAHLIERVLWLLMAGMLATLDVLHATDEKGQPIIPEVTYDNAVFRMPSPFPCMFKPRSEQALALFTG